MNRAAEEWQILASCRGLDPHLFFSDRPEVQERARRVCSMCPVQTECQSAAARRGVQVGVWGGQVAVGDELAAKQRLQRRRRAELPAYSHAPSETVRPRSTTLPSR